MSEPFLVYRRTGRTIGAVLGFGFGGGTVLLGVTTTLARSFQLGPAAAAFRGYFMASLPFFVAGVLVAMCRRELWFLPGERVFRMLTFRPWLVRGPRVEQASLEEYRALRTHRQEHSAEQASTIVSLVTEGGDAVPVREFDRPEEAASFVERFAAATGLTLAAEEPRG